MGLILIVFTLFMTGTWQIGFILRIPSQVALYSYTYSTRGGTKQFLAGFIVMLVGLTITLETAIYLQVKSKAYLFSRLKQSEAQ